VPIGGVLAEILDLCELNSARDGGIKVLTEDQISAFGKRLCAAFSGWSRSVGRADRTGS